MTVNTSAGKINASKPLLNLIASYAAEAAQMHERNGMHAIAKQADEVAEQIHAALKDTGYYDF